MKTGINQHKGDTQLLIKGHVASAINRVEFRSVEDRAAMSRFIHLAYEAGVRDGKKD